VIVHRGGSGEPVVLIHGLGSHAAVWRSVLPLLEQRREVITLDMPGFGAAPPGETTVPGLADAVERDMLEAGLERAHLVGNSLGGWVALELAKRGRAVTVVALSPAGKWTGLREALSRFQLITSFWGSKLIAGAGTRPYGKAAARKAMSRTYRVHGDRATPEEMADDMRALARSKGFLPLWRWTLRRNIEGLDQVRCPVLIAWGEHDRLLNRRQGPRFVEEIEGSELKLLPDTGHICMADDPELVVETILEFQDLEGAAAA
jgi:pimeloyl-ACP methyl ester carboxylesterase